MHDEERAYATRHAASKACSRMQQEPGTAEAMQQKLLAMRCSQGEWTVAQSDPSFIIKAS